MRVLRLITEVQDSMAMGRREDESSIRLASESAKVIWITCQCSLATGMTAKLWIQPEHAGVTTSHGFGHRHWIPPYPAVIADDFIWRMILELRATSPNSQPHPYHKND
jgi:hypothetical protein